MHTHSSILNLYFCTHNMQQHCCNVVEKYIRKSIYGCAHVSHVRIRRAVVFVSYKSRVGSGWRKNAWKKMNNLDEKIRRDHIRRENCNVLHWSKTRGRLTTQCEHARVSVRCKQTYYCGRKQQQEVPCKGEKATGTLLVVEEKTIWATKKTALP